MRLANPGVVARELERLMGSEWAKLSPDQKAPYDREAALQNEETQRAQAEAAAAIQAGGFPNGAGYGFGVKSIQWLWTLGVSC